MKRLVLASAIASSVALSGCATDVRLQCIYDPQARRAAQGAVVGGAGGAITGAVVAGSIR